jgi:hypothetical protein
MTKSYYIKMPEALMNSTIFNSTEKLFISFLEVLTDKGTKGTDKSTSFLASKIGVSNAYISTLLKKMLARKVVRVGKEYGRRVIYINEKGLLEQGFITKKTKRGKNAKPAK